MPEPRAALEAILKELNDQAYPKDGFHRWRTYALATTVVFSKTPVPKRVLKESHKPKIVFMRQVLIYLLKEHIKSLGEPISFMQIAVLLRYSDHCAVFHGHRKIEELLETDTELQEKVANIRALCA